MAVQTGLCRTWSETTEDRVSHNEAHIKVGLEGVCIGGGVAQRLGRRISDQGVPGSNPGRCTFRCGLEQVTFTLLSTG